MLTYEDVQDLIAHLEGTCQSLDEACQDLFNEDADILTDEDIELIHDEVFCCAFCGWWFALDVHYQHYDELICECCKTEIEEKEENDNYF